MYIIIVYIIHMICVIYDPPSNIHMVFDIILCMHCLGKIDV